MAMIRLVDHHLVGLPPVGLQSVDLLLEDLRVDHRLDLLQVPQVGLLRDPHQAHLLGLRVGSLLDRLLDHHLGRRRAALLQNHL